MPILSNPYNSYYPTFGSGNPGSTCGTCFSLFEKYEQAKACSTTPVAFPSQIFTTAPPSPTYIEIGGSYEAQLLEIVWRNGYARPSRSGRRRDHWFGSPDGFRYRRQGRA